MDMQKHGRERIPLAQGRGGDGECQAASTQEWPKGATQRLRSGTAAKRSNPTSKEQWLLGQRRAKRIYSTFKDRKGGHEETPLVQGKERQLHFLEQP